MKKINEVNKLADKVVKSIDNKFCFSVEIDGEISNYYHLNTTNYIDTLKLAYNEYVNSILKIGTDECDIKNIISLEIVEIDDEDSVIETHYLDTFEL